MRQVCYLIILFVLINFTNKLLAESKFILFQKTKGVSFQEPQQNRIDSLDEYAKKTPKEYEKDIKTLASYLIIPAKSEIEKARLLFTWVATHVKYDAAAFNSGKYPEQSTEGVLKKKKAVCEGYSNLLKDLCSAAGLEAEKVSGYSKGYGYKPGKKFKQSDHAWNVIKIDGKWKLFDVTWASGYGTNVDGKLKSTSRFDPYWFDVNPKEFIFSHLPEEDKWQLLEETITLKQYEKLPKLDDTFFKLGFNLDQVYSDAINGTVEEFAETFTIPCPVKAIQLPYTKKIKRSETIEFILQSEQATEMVLIDGKDWIPFTKEGNTFSLSHQPKHKKISITLKTSKTGKNYSGIINYKGIK